MKLNKFLMSAGIAAIVAGGAFAQDTAVEPEDDAVAAEEPMTPAEPMADDMASPADPMADPTAEGEAMQPTFTSLEEMTVGDVVGFVAYDPEGNRIAEIDYVIQASADAEAEAVLGIGGFLGLGEHTAGVPLSNFELREDGMSFQLNADKEMLKERPEIDEANIEGLPDETPISQLLAAAEPVEEPAVTEEAPAATDDATEEAPMAEEEPMASDDTATESEEELDTDVATETEEPVETEEESTVQ
ncbi:hypothetical protein [Maritimibacter sp. DP1N21-5]|uniref:hypothetical protein n=1 Tax=Maritimibacter sp. DP1N21-5 TaxID=2836867 RepID=UPI001C442AB6|nr:hypothetical protein [Maritimibacter sp. DP1N21-5]MBV7410968.1 hypothetical protein [Maritimibacter sp. DP1N21-5]